MIYTPVLLGCLRKIYRALGTLIRFKDVKNVKVEPSIFVILTVSPPPGGGGFPLLLRPYKTVGFVRTRYSRKLRSTRGGTRPV